jgi:hypothetical protein
MDLYTVVHFTDNSKAEEAEAALQKDKDVSFGEMAKTITISFFKACFKLVKMFAFISL